MGSRGLLHAQIFKFSSSLGTALCPRFLEYSRKPILANVGSWFSFREEN